jgi:hypothetical protein
MLKIWQSMNAEFIACKIHLKNYSLELIRKLFDTENNSILLYGPNFILVMPVVSSARVQPPAR